MAKIDYLLSILWLLRSKGRMTVEQLAEALELIVRTVYRYVDILSTSGVPVISMHAFMKTLGLVQSGLHHEIYLSDPLQSRSVVHEDHSSSSRKRNLAGSFGTARRSFELQDKPGLLEMLTFFV